MYKKLCYKLITENKHLFDLKLYDQDHSMDIELIQKYIQDQPCSKEYNKLLLELTKNIRYISCQEFIEIYDKNLLEIIELIQSGLIPIIILPDYIINKSFFFLTLYLLFNLQKNGIIIEYIYDAMTQEIFNEINQKEEKKDGVPKSFFLIFTDDFSYSGKQLFIELEKNSKIEMNDCKFFLNIVGLTSNALTRFNKIKKYGLIFPGYIIRIDENHSSLSINNFLKKYLGENFKREILLIDQYIIKINRESKQIKLIPSFFNTFNKSQRKNTPTQTFIYLFMKYPDFFSTIQYLCEFPVNKSDDKVLDTTKFIEYFKIKPDKFIDELIKLNHNNSINFIDLILALGISQEEIDKIFDQESKSILPIFSNKCIHVDYKLNMIKNGIYDKTSLSEVIKDTVICEKTIIPFYKTLKYTYNEYNIDLNLTLSELHSNIKKGVYIEKCTNTYGRLLQTMGLLNKSNITIELINSLFELTKCNKEFIYNKIPIVQKVLKKINQSDKCFRISKKCTDCYIHTYNPSWLNDLLQTQPNYEEIVNIFDVKIRTKCCNCVCLVLYLKGELQQKIDYLNKILKIMIMSLKIIDKHLPDFIVRFYLDSSIFELLYEWSSSLLITKDTTEMELIKDIFLDLSYLIHHKKSEIYIYFCESITSHTDFIEKVRTYRYIPLFDDDTNVCCIRDADGIISIVDCHNIKLFSSPKTHNIALIYNLARSFDPYLYDKHLNKILDINEFIKNKQFVEDLDPMLNHYSAWLNFYETLVLSKKEPKTLSYIDIIACCICMKIKFTEEYRQKIISDLDCYYDSDEFDSISKSNNVIGTKLKIGYDEILLLELFSPMIRVSYNKLGLINKLNREEINLKSKLFKLIETKHESYFLGFDTILKYFNINNESEIIQYLSKNEIQGEINYNSKYIDIVFKNFKLKNEFKNYYFGFGISTLINRNNINNNEFKSIYGL